MRTKKQLSIGLVVMLALSLAIVFPTIVPVASQVESYPAQAMWVDPNFTDGLSSGDTFTIDIYVNITDPDGGGPALGLYAWEFKLYYRNDKLNLTNDVTHLPFGDWATPNNFPAGAGVQQNFNATHGRYWKGLSAVPTVMPFPTPFTGVMSISTLTFKVIAPAGGPEFIGLLALRETITGHDQGAGFAHTAYDGYYRMPPTPLPTPLLAIAPSYVMGTLGVQFNISITIDGLAPAHNLCGWEAKVFYNTTVLDGLNAFEGPFLPGFAGPNGTFFLNVTDDPNGYIHVAGLFLGNHTNPFTAGPEVLAYLMFNATYEFEVPGEGSPPFLFPLDLNQTILSDCASQTIGHNTRDGEYEAPFRTLGWSLDCYTWPYRKPLLNGSLYETPFTGEGPNFPADAFEPQELVVIYSYLSYNQQPEVAKDVLFEVRGPANPYYNITIFRVARTDWYGVAMINFTIPWPDTNPDDIVIGKWCCFQKVQVKDPWNPPYYATPNDTLCFDVGWIVELVNVTVDPTPIPKEEMLYITVCYKVISQIPRWVVFTFTILDDLLDPIGDTILALWVEPGVYCNPAEDCITVMMYIPRWAHVGPRAVVYVNALSALPMDCGVPYSPE
jgi:hypothetical protein